MSLNPNIFSSFGLSNEGRPSISTLGLIMEVYQLLWKWKNCAMHCNHSNTTTTTTRSYHYYYYCYRDIVLSEQNKGIEQNRTDSSSTRVTPCPHNLPITLWLSQWITVGSESKCVCSGLDIIPFQSTKCIWLWHGAGAESTLPAVWMMCSSRCTSSAATWGFMMCPSSFKTCGANFCINLVEAVYLWHFRFALALMSTSALLFHAPYVSTFGLQQPFSLHFGIQMNK